MGTKLGINAKIIRNTGIYGTPVLNVIDNASDVQVNAAWDEADASTRGTRVKLSLKTLLGLEFSVKVRVDSTDTDFVALDDAAKADTKLDLHVLDGFPTTDGVRGWRFWGQVFQDNEDQSMGAVLFREFTIKPTVPDVAAELPKRVVVASGAPVYTTPWVVEEEEE